MIPQLEISVVMAAYNAGPSLHKTIDSILVQEGPAFEFIIVNDGSSDDTAEIIEHYRQRDGRIRTHHKENSGLTESLKIGCQMARGRLIARQDTGDISIQGKLAKLEKCFVDDEVVMAACGTAFVGPEGDTLWTVSQDDDALRSGLSKISFPGIVGPSSHAATMFRRSTYEQVGGYRREFRFAQDLDLWLRLVEVGRVRALPEILYEAEVRPFSISGLRNREQIRLAEYILECTRKRRSGESEAVVLATAQQYSDKLGNPHISRLSRARGLYSMASYLHRANPGLAKKYYQRAVMQFPVYPRAIYKLMKLYSKAGT